MEKEWICNRRSNLPSLRVKDGGADGDGGYDGTREQEEAGWKCWAIFRTPGLASINAKTLKGTSKEMAGSIIRPSRPTLASCRFRSGFIRLNGIHSEEESRFRQ